MRLTWLNDGFICKDLYAPFTVEKDTDYITDLAERYSLLLNQAINAGADIDSVSIIKKYRMKIIEALKCYYCADIGKCNTIIRNLLRDIGEHPFAISALNSSYAFPGEIGSELQLFRCRIGNPANAFSAKEMLHLPRSLRAKSGNYRFSIPGNPSLYLSNSSYGCWIETGFPSDNEFNVSPVLLDGTQKVLNLVLSVRDFSRLNEFEGERVHIWLKLLMEIPVKEGRRSAPTVRLVRLYRCEAPPSIVKSIVASSQIYKAYITNNTKIKRARSGWGAGVRVSAGPHVDIYQHYTLQ